jgi:hypothetical protein
MLSKLQRGQSLKIANLVSCNMEQSTKIASGGPRNLHRKADVMIKPEE